MANERSIRAAVWQALAVVVTVACLADAQVIQKWKTKEGTLYFGDHPPPGATKIGQEGKPEPERENLPPEAEAPKRSPEGDRRSTELSNERNRIEKDLNRDAERLAEVQQKIGRVERTPAVVDPWMQKGLGLPNEKGEELKKLRGEQKDIASAMVREWQAFDELDGRVRKDFGGSAPDWWRKLSCSKCPSRQEVAALVK